MPRKKEVTVEEKAIEVAKGVLDSKDYLNIKEVFVMGGSCFLDLNRAVNAKMYLKNPKPEIFKVIKDGKELKAEKLA